MTLHNRILMKSQIRQLIIIFLQLEYEEKIDVNLLGILFFFLLLTDRNSHIFYHAVFFKLQNSPFYLVMA